MKSQIAPLLGLGSGIFESGTHVELNHLNLMPDIFRYNLQLLMGKMYCMQLEVPALSELIFAFNTSLSGTLTHTHTYSTPSLCLYFSYFHSDLSILLLTYHPTSSSLPSSLLFFVIQPYTLSA